MAIDVSFADYVRGVRTSAQGAVVLAARLEWAAPTDITPDEKKALRVVKARAADVQEVLGDRDRLAPGKMRPLLVAFANDWSALYDALTAKARLPSHVSNRGPDAAMLSMSLLPDGESFTQLDAETARVEGQRRIARIHDEQLAPRIELLVGDGFIEAVKNSTGILGNALGTGRQKRTIPSTTALQEALVRFGKAVGAYGRVLAWQVDEEDEASVKRFLDAVEPMDVHRAAQRDGGTSSSDTTQDPTSTDTTAAAAPSDTATPKHPLAHSPTSNGGVAAPSSTSNGTVAPATSATSSGSSPAANGSAPAANGTSNVATPNAGTPTVGVAANTTGSGANVAA